MTGIMSESFGFIFILIIIVMVQMVMALIWRILQDSLGLLLPHYSSAIVDNCRHILLQPKVYSAGITERMLLCKFSHMYQELYLC